jgi:hypothetical protein
MNHMIDLFLLSATAVRQNLRAVETLPMHATVTPCWNAIRLSATPRNIRSPSTAQ